MLGHRLEVLGQRRLAARLITDFAAMSALERNTARFVFLSPHAREHTATGIRPPLTPRRCSAWGRASILKPRTRPSRARPLHSVP
ncbi:hypothetical protein [Tamaricihabitans halophyticus]|uniref:MmyB family transcriptional regulator n=1 Tax=Tamaricihabitans halophyticus TaxID=1262583 RepID=UPI001FB2B574|nr:hypothetical protein [Tamaricihabitans halophyticus]